MQLRQLVVIIGFCGISMGCAALEAAGAYTLSRGREILLNQGLQIQSLNSPNPGWPDYERWRGANFTTYNLWDRNLDPLASFAEGQQWGYAYNLSKPSTKYAAAGTLHADTLVSYQYDDELPESEFTDPARLADMAATYTQWRQLYPNVLAYTNNSTGGGFVSDPVLANYMQVTQPDMIMFDFYPPFSYAVQWRNKWYKTMQKYRTLGLAGNDGTGTAPIAYAQFLKLYRKSYDNSLPSESYVRLQQNASWAFGYSVVTAFVYNGIGDGGFIDAVMFDTPDDSAPNAVFDYVEEANRQSRNLGPALVRLVSTDIRMIPSTYDTQPEAYWDPECECWQTRLVDMDWPLPVGIAAWSPGTADTGGYSDYITGITPLGNDHGVSHLHNDVLVGYFEPLLDDNPGFTFADGLHFMIVNGSAGTEFFPDNPAGDPAANHAESYHLTFDFTGSDFDSLVRLSRDTGQVELVPLTPTGGPEYYLDLVLPGGTGDLFAFWDSSQPLPTPSGSPVDLDGDGDVDGTDFLILQRIDPGLLPQWEAEFGQTAAGGTARAVPEPAAAALAGLGLVGWSVVRRKRVQGHSCLDRRPAIGLF